jgi:hypothetical protein
MSSEAEAADDATAAASMTASKAKVRNEKFLSGDRIRT